MTQAASLAPSALAIRPASVSDAATISALAQRIWPQCFAGILEPHQIRNMLGIIYSPDSLKEQMREGQRFWIATYDGRDAGYVSAYQNEDTIWLKKLYCDPEFQGKGIGTALFETATSAFKPAGEIRLLVHRDNLPAQRYYVHLGFERVGELPVVMGDFPFVDFIYRKTLL